LFTPSGYFIQWIRADGAGETQTLWKSTTQHRPASLTPDGRYLAFTNLDPHTNYDIWTVPLDLSDPERPKPGKAEPFLRTPANEGMPAFSPDGRWMAYASSESGRNEVYVRPFPGPGGKWQISTTGGIYPIWSRDGRNLFFEAADNRIMAVDYTTRQDSFSVGKPRRWAETTIFAPDGAGFAHADLAPDGKHFAVFPTADANGESKGSVHAVFLLNFFDDLMRKAPAK